MPVKVRKLRDFTKMRKSQHFTKNYTNKFNLLQNHVNLVISVQSDKASTRKLEAVFGKDSLPLVIDNIVSVSCHWQKSVLFFCTFPSTFYLFIKVPGKKVSFTSTPFQALFIFSQKVPGKKVPGSQDPRIPHILHP